MAYLTENEIKDAVKKCKELFEHIKKVYELSLNKFHGIYFIDDKICNVLNIVNLSERPYIIKSDILKRKRLYLLRKQEIDKIIYDCESVIKLDIPFIRKLWKDLIKSFDEVNALYEEIPELKKIISKGSFFGMKPYVIEALMHICEGIKTKAIKLSDQEATKIVCQEACYKGIAKEMDKRVYDFIIPSVYSRMLTRLYVLWERN